MLVTMFCAESPEDVDVLGIEDEDDEGFNTGSVLLKLAGLLLEDAGVGIGPVYTV